ncbi:hypothetical protein LIER_16238 [Lithospermum erythrorhizon]|uniref:Uncharacterized protein n=1 Tax=Lithospermum erythrorhizon TaxID=34254 RepID=A0AAV3Q935_LITER
MEEEDPFAFLLLNSKPSISQEEILRNCPFAKEHDHFMDSDTQSSTWVSSQQTGIIMESLPDSDNVNDVKDGVHDDDKFLTPPEHHFYSVSDSEDVEVGFIEGKSELNVDCGGAGVGVGGFQVVGSGDLEENEGFEANGDVGVGIEEVGSDDLGKLNEFDAEGDVGVEIDESGSGNLAKSHNFGIVGGVEVGIEEVGSGYLGKREELGAEGGVEVAIEGSSNGDLVKIDDFGVEGDIGIGIKKVGISDFEVLGSGDLGKRRDFGAKGDVQVGMEVDKMNLEGEGCDCVIKDHELEVCGGEFDKKGVFGGETESKEVTVETLELPVETDCVKGTQDTQNVDTEVTYLPSGETVSNEDTVEVEAGVETDCVKGTQETENVDTEDIYLPSEGTVVCCGDDETEVVDDMEVQSRVALGGDQVGDLGFGMEGNLEGEQCDYIVHDTQTEVVVSEFDKNGVLDAEIMSKKIMVSEELESGVCEVGTGCVEKMQHIANINTYIIPDSEEQTEEITLNNEKLVTHLNLAKKDHHEGNIVSKRKLLEQNMGDDGGLNVVSSGKNELVNSEDIHGIENGGHKENVNLGIRGKRKVQRSDTIRSGKSKEDIEKFRYVKPSVGADQRGEDKRVPEEGNVPLSKTENAPRIEVGHGSVYKGNSSFLKLVYKASEVLKLEVDPDHNVDLLDIFKEKGITLPRPRWWPPEGFN